MQVGKLLTNDGRLLSLQVVSMPISLFSDRRLGMAAIKSLNTGGLIEFEYCLEHPTLLGTMC